MKRLLKMAALMLTMGTAQVALASAPPEVIDIQNLTFDPAVILELYNKVDNIDTGEIHEYPAGLNPNVFTMSVNNKSGAPKILCFRLSVKEVGGSNMTIVTGSEIQTINPVPEGIHLLNASHFTAVTFDATANKTWTDENFDEIDGEEGLKKILNMKFQVCVTPIYCGSGNPGNPDGGTVACTTLNIFKGGAGAVSSVAILVRPHNEVIQESNRLPLFIFVPARKSGVPQNEIRHMIEITEGSANGAVLDRKEVPEGSSSYQWRATDPVFKPNTEYFWKVISTHNGVTIGGPSDRGWNIVKRFEFRGQKKDLTVNFDLFMTWILGAAPQVTKEAIDQLKIESIVTDDADTREFINQLLSGKAKASGFTFEKN